MVVPELQALAGVVKLLVVSEVAAVCRLVALNLTGDKVVYRGVLSHFSDNKDKESTEIVLVSTVAGKAPEAAPFEEPVKFKELKDFGVPVAEDKGVAAAVELAVVVQVPSAETAPAVEGKAQRLTSGSPITCLYSRMSCVRLA